MTALKLGTVLGDHPHMRALKAGEVKSDLVALDFVEFSPTNAAFKPMVRELYQKRGVITFVASREEPSDVDVPSGHRTFALGLMRVFQGAGAGGKRSDPYTLDQFKTSLRDEVLNLSERRQEAFGYIPLHVPEQTWFARP